MAINKKLIHFTNKVNFLNEYNKGNILPTSIVFIQDAKQIWTHDEFYSCPFTEEEINQLLVGSNIKLNGYTEITSPIEISATDTVNQAFGKIEDYLNSILELNAVLVDTGDAVYESPMINDYITANTFSSTLLNYVSDSELASKNYATKQDIADLVDGAPETLDTLNELAAALKDNSNIVDILNESISNKLSKTEAAENYQVKGDYITKTEVANSYLVKGNYVEEDNYFKWSKLILPSFTIAGVSYDFEEGMTWEDWVNSDYNTNGAYMGGGQEILLAKETYILKENSYSYCASWEVINSSEKYRIYQWDGTGMRPGVEL